MVDLQIIIIVIYIPNLSITFKNFKFCYVQLSRKCSFNRLNNKKACVFDRYLLYPRFLNNHKADLNVTFTIQLQFAMEYFKLKQFTLSSIEFLPGHLKYFSVFK